MSAPRATRPVRRALTAAVAVLVLGGLTTACGSDADTTSTDGGEQTRTSTTKPADGAAGTSDPAPAAFPIVVEHAFGSTEVAEEPERIVSVGYTEQDMLLALGIIPVGITDWYGDQPYGVWPWAQEALGDATPEVLSVEDGFELEKIKRLQPDLIIGTNAGMTEDDYADLTAIAPTIPQADAEASGYFSEWDEQSLLIGKAVGKEAEAQALVDGVKAKFAEAAEAHPEFAGTKAIFLQNAFYDGEAIAYQDGLSTAFLTDLGFVVPPELDDYLGEEEGSQAYIPLEQLSVLDAGDVLIWGTEDDEDRGNLEKEALYRDLRAVEDGDLVFTDGLTAGAIYFTSVLSLPYVLDQLVPALAATLDGKGPATITPDGLQLDE